MYINGFSHIFYEFTRKKLIKTVAGFYINTIELFAGLLFSYVLLCRFFFILITTKVLCIIQRKLNKYQCVAKGRRCRVFTIRTGGLVKPLAVTVIESLYQRSNFIDASKKVYF